MRMFHLAIKKFEGFVEWLNEIYALISMRISQIGALELAQEEHLYQA